MEQKYFFLSLKRPLLDRKLYRTHKKRSFTRKVLTQVSGICCKSIPRATRTNRMLGIESLLGRRNKQDVVMLFRIRIITESTVFDLGVLSFFNHQILAGINKPYMEPYFLRF